MIIDSHAHLTDPKLLPDIEVLLVQADQEQVNKVISIGTTIEDSVKNLEIADAWPQVFAGIGVYPDEMEETSIIEIEKQLTKLLAHPKVVGVGETGIDINIQKNGELIQQVLNVDLNRQKELFELHIKLAQEFGLPLIIHNRNADEITLEILQRHKFPNMTGVFHCYTSSWDFAQKVLDLGFYLSFTGIITYPSGTSILDTVKNVPNDKFLIETDAPYLAPIPHRRKINKPEYVKITLQKIAEVKQISLEDAQELAYQNTQRLFFAKES
jgi:TatD DNase family protein